MVVPSWNFEKIHNTLLPVLSKVFECNMSNLLYDHLLEHAHISTKQRGFLYQAGQQQMLLCLPLMTGTNSWQWLWSMHHLFDLISEGSWQHAHCSLIAKLRQQNINEFVLKWTFACHCKNTCVTSTTFVGCPSFISVTKECYQIGFLGIPVRCLS